MRGTPLWLASPAAAAGDVLSPLRRRGKSWLCAGAAVLWLWVPNARAALEDLVGRWKMQSNSIVEIQSESGRLVGRLKEVSDSGRQRNFKVGDVVLKDFEPRGDGFVFKAALHENGPPYTEQWLDCTGANLDRGTLAGTVLMKQFVDHKWPSDSESPGTPMEFTLVPRCPKQLKDTLELGTLGGTQINVQLTAPLEPDPDEPAGNPPDPRARKGFCRMEGNGIASTEFQTSDIPGGNGVFKVTKTIADCDIELFWKEYTDRRKENGISETTLAWTDDGTAEIQLFERWGIGFKVYAFGATFKREQGDALTMNDAFLDVQMDVAGPTQVMGPLYIAGDLSSTISYVWSADGAGATSWTGGQWSFSGMANVLFELRSGGVQPIATLRVALNEQGEGPGTFTLNSRQAWSSGGYEVALKSCDLKGLVSLKDGTITITGGSISGAVAAGAPLKGQFDLTLARERREAGGNVADVFVASIASTSAIEAFGGKLTKLQVTTDLNPDTLEFTKIEGSVAYQRPETTVTINGFTIENGELTRFLGSGEVQYNGFALNIRQLSYNTALTPAVIEVAAAVNLGWSNGGAAAADLENFKISTDGVVSTFSLHAGVHATPVDVDFNATFTGQAFSGRFRGQLAGSADFGGEVLIGRETDFTYGSLSIFFNISGGVPIGQTGLKLLGLNGAFGCKYNPPDSPLPYPPGPNRDIYYIRAGLTIGDAAGLASLNGTVSVYLGKASAIGIEGTVQVTQSTPYFRGSLSCNYVLGSGEISGALATTVHLPVNGSIVSINNNTLRYEMNRAGWKLNGNGLGGTFFGFAKLSDGWIDLSCPADRSISEMTGHLGGRIEGRTSTWWAYPSNFRCENSTYDFGIAANFSAEIAGALSNVELSPSGSQGTFKLQVTLSGTGSLRLRSGWFGFDCASVGLTATGLLDATKSQNGLALDGNLTFADSSGWISKSLHFSGAF